MFFKPSETNKDQISFSNWQENLRFHYYRGKGHLFRYLLNRFAWYYYPRFHYVSPYPEHVDMELSSTCNMRCPMCYTNTPEYIKQVKKGLMDRGLWQKIVRECAAGKVFSLRLSLRGESTLHPDFVEALRLAKELGIKEVSTLSNALLLTPKMFEELVDAGLDWLTISADGVGETYEKIRRPARFNDLIEKLKSFQAIKRIKRSFKPVIKVQTVWPAIQANPQAYYNIFKPLVDQVSCNKYIDYSIRYNETGIGKKKPELDCFVLYQRLTIGSDGGVMLCVNDEMCQNRIGDLNHQSIYDIWHGDGLTTARRLHRQNMAIQHYELCKQCYLSNEDESLTKVNISGRDVQIDSYSGMKQEVGIQ